MPERRPTPFDLVFGGLAEERFPALSTALAAAGSDGRDRNAFVLVREVAELLHELRPDAGLGGALPALVALLHNAYLFWLDGQQVRRISEPELAALLNLPARPLGPSAPLPACRYLQLPALRVWATPMAGQPSEPLDGWFTARAAEQLSLLAVFGLSPSRPGLTAVELAGPRPGPLERPDGSPLFAPLLEGGAAAGLASLASEEELLELAWRIEESR